MLLAREQPDLIVCGRNSTDAETGQVGPELAELLGLPHLSQVRRLTYEAVIYRDFPLLQAVIVHWLPEHAQAEPPAGQAAQAPPQRR